MRAFFPSPLFNMTRLATTAYALMRLLFCAPVALALMAGLAWGVENLAESIRSGELWKTSPGQVWKKYLKDAQVYTVNENILITGKSSKPDAQPLPAESAPARGFWFWESTLHSVEGWETAWNNTSFKTETPRLERFSSPESMRLKRLSIMLYRAGTDSKEIDAEKCLADCVAELEQWGMSAQPMQEKQDVAGRSITIRTWQGEKSVCMLEYATANETPDYIRLTFAPDAASLYYARTAKEQLATEEELRKRVQRRSGYQQITDFPCYMHRGVAYAPSWFTTLCYYGYHDIDNYSPAQPKNTYPGEYEEKLLRSTSKSKKLYEAFTRYYKRHKDLSILEMDIAEETYASEQYADETEKWWEELHKHTSAGYPVVYGTRDSYAIIASYYRSGEKYVSNDRAEEINASRCFMQPQAYYIIIPAGAQHGPDADADPSRAR